VAGTTDIVMDLNSPNESVFTGRVKLVSSRILRHIVVPLSVTCVNTEYIVGCEAGPGTSQSGCDIHSGIEPGVWTQPAIQWIGSGAGWRQCLCEAKAEA
jgi:hypothetical protein